MIDAATGKVVTTIDLGGRPETGQADPALGRLFFNLEDKDAIGAIDVETHKIVATWPIAPGTSPSGLAIDTATHRLFAGAGKFMVMVDAKSGALLSQVPIGQGVDATWFDPTTALDTNTHKIYLGAVSYQPPAPDAAANARPQAVPDTFHILVYGTSRGMSQ